MAANFILERKINSLARSLAELLFEMRDWTGEHTFDNALFELRDDFKNIVDEVEENYKEAHTDYTDE